MTAAGTAPVDPGSGAPAVVGVPGECHGETVKAFVSLRPGESVDELPKTVTGRILPRELRAGHTGPA
jgi:long-chain acyl-CoA synthetase